MEHKNYLLYYKVQMKKKNYNMDRLIFSLLACLSPTTPTGYLVPLSHVLNGRITTCR